MERSPRVSSPARVVSIGMPLFNEARYLESALDSLLRQTWEDFELIVCDNGSTDRTWDICRDFGLRDPRVRLFRNPENLGAIWNFNRVLDLARGEYFMWAGGHDLWHPTYLQRCLEPLRQAAAVVLSHSLTVMIDDRGRGLGIMPGWLDTRGVGQIFRYNMVQWGIVNGNMICGVMRRSALTRTGRCRYNLGPHLVLLSELSILGEFAVVPAPLFCRRQFRSEEDIVTKLNRWHHTLDPQRSLRPMRVQLAHLAWEYIAAVLRARVGFWPKLLLVLSVLLTLVAKTAEFLKYQGRQTPASVLPGTAAAIEPWPGGPLPASSAGSQDSAAGS